MKIKLKLKGIPLSNIKMGETFVSSNIKKDTIFMRVGGMPHPGNGRVWIINLMDGKLEAVAATQEVLPVPAHLTVEETLTTVESKSDKEKPLPGFRGVGESFAGGMSGGMPHECAVCENSLCRTMQRMFPRDPLREEPRICRLKNLWRTPTR